MNPAWLGLVILPSLLADCHGVVVVHERPYPPPPPPVVVYQAAPTYVEEGSVYGGVVVAPVDPGEYVFMGGAYYYWNPGLRIWVHAHRGEGWRPGPRARIHERWEEHPMYHR